MKLLVRILCCTAGISLPALGQSSLESDPGTDINVTAGADICADAVTLNGTFSGDGTRCEGPLPITLASFRARIGPGGLGVSLEWKTLSETNNFGFYVQSKRGDETTFSDIAGSFIAGHGTTLEPHTYTCTVSGDVRTTMSVRLKQVDLDGAIHVSEAVTVSGLNIPEPAPIAFALDQNYPNPFNPSTEFRFSVASAGFTTLTVYNILGQDVGRVFAGEAVTGRYYVARFDGRGLASGIYYARLTNGGSSRSKKMILSK